MTELGQTKDPKALVPGDATSLEHSARALRKQSDRLEQVGSDLRRIDVRTWTGPASEAFMETLSKEPPKWLKVSDALDSSSRALIGYADTLRWAQARAEDAIELWEKAEAERAKAAGGEEGAALAQASAGAFVAAPLIDPGAKQRQEARALLDRAREQLDEVGRQTARKIGSHNANGEDALSIVVDALTAGWKQEGKATASGPGAGFSASGPKGGKLGELKAFAELGKASAEGSVGSQFANLAGKAEASVGAEATASASATNEGLVGRAEVAAGAKAVAEGRAELGAVGYSGKAEGFAGAKAGVEAKATKDGVSLGADAFAGAKGTLKGGGDVAGIGVSATAEGWAGAGAEAGVDFGMNDEGKFEIGASAGVSPALGGKLGFELSIDPDEVSETAGEAAGAVGDAAGVVGDAAGVVGDAAGSAQRTISGWLD